MADNKTGFEIKIKLNGNTIQWRWFKGEKAVNAGDSHLFPLLFPIPNTISDNPTQPNQLKKIKTKGFKIRSTWSVGINSRIYSLGFPLLRQTSNGKFKLRLMEGMKAKIGDKKYKNQHEPYLDITINPLATGIVYGKKDWTLEFKLVKYSPRYFDRDPAITPFFGQALLYAFILVFGLLYLGFLQKKDLEIDFDYSSHSQRLVQYKRNKKDKKKEAKIEEKIEAPQKKPVLKTALLNRKIQRKTKKLKAPNKIKLKFLFNKNKTATPMAKANDSDSKDAKPDETEGDSNSEDNGNDNNQGNGLNNSSSKQVGIPSQTPKFKISAPVKKAVKAPPYIKIRPKRKYFPAITYPESAKYLGIEGKVRLKLFINEKGKIYKVVVLKKLHPMLDRAAVAGAKKARYKPAVDQYGNPIKSKSIISIRFKIEEEEF